MIGKGVVFATPMLNMAPPESDLHVSASIWRGNAKLCQGSLPLSADAFISKPSRTTWPQQGHFCFPFARPIATLRVLSATPACVAATLTAIP